MKPPSKKENKAVYSFVHKRSRCVWEPGTKDGPCVRCTHPECVELRSVVDRACTICGKAVGYAMPFVEEGSEVTHTSCFMGVRLECGAVH